MQPRPPISAPASAGTLAPLDWHLHCTVAPIPGVYRVRGGAIKRSIWIPVWERETWITLAEILVLSLVIITPGTAIRLLIGLPLLFHLGWTTLTSLPVGKIPGPPKGISERRRNHDLRTRVVAFLNEVQRVERYVQQAEETGLPQSKLGESLRSAERRMLATAEEVVKLTGRAPEGYEYGRVERPGLDRTRIDPRGSFQDFRPRSS